MRHYVMFERELDDETSPVARSAPAPVHFHQLREELGMLDLPMLAAHFIGSTHCMFLTVLDHEGDVPALRDHLQTIYDQQGVAGYFTIATPPRA